MELVLRRTLTVLEPTRSCVRLACWVAAGWFKKWAEIGRRWAKMGPMPRDGSGMGKNHPKMVHKRLKTIQKYFKMAPKRPKLLLPLLLPPSTAIYCTCYCCCYCCCLAVAIGGSQSYLFLDIHMTVHFLWTCTIWFLQLSFIIQSGSKSAPEIGKDLFYFLGSFFVIFGPLMVPLHEGISRYIEI